MRRIILQPGEQFTNAHLKRTGAFNAQALTAATAIIEGVRERGDEALRAYTAGSAAAAQREGELGQLAPGMFADIVVLDPNPFELAPEDIQQAKVQATYVAGKKAYER